MLGRMVSIRIKRFAFAASVAVSTGFLAPMTAQAEITYEQILAAPDDSKLNLAYARQAAALERLLLARPNWDSVRLFYGFVLYRLDDMTGAKRELRAL